MNNVFKKIMSFISFDKSIVENISKINLQRILYIAFVMMIVHVAHVVLFLRHNPDVVNAASITWQQWIIWAHFLMGIIAFIFGVVAYIIKKRNLETTKLSFVFQGCVILSYYMFGVVISVIDQLVTAQITPFLMASIGIAITLIIHPVLAIGNYLLAFIVLYNSISLTQTNHDLVLSIQVNAITAIGMSFGIAILLWRNQVLRIQQKNTIEQQNIELENKNKQLEYLATHDQLTGLFNRTYFMQYIEQRIINDAETANDACIIIIDIDYFKKINDNIGHPGGDYVLQVIAKLLLDNVKETDVVARLGGEEFIILLPNRTLDKSLIEAEKLRKMINSKTISYHHQEIRVTASFGIAELNPNDPNCIGNCYFQADKALYSAKESGRNRIEIA
jgi:diguanylate cyclase (GGDEF)-like protein